ncbi:hypothetical protein HGO38_21165 [Rhizobium sp. CG5]|nr:hypothetical protein [Rhizobium sp. CG5]
MSFLNDSVKPGDPYGLFKEAKAMSCQPFRVLVAEKQLLIAMEVEAILADALGCVVNVCPRYDLEAELATARYDVVVLDAAPSINRNAEYANLIQEHGAVPIFLTSYDDISGNLPQLRHSIVIAKPFDDKIIIEAVRQASSRSPA